MDRKLSIPSKYKVDYPKKLCVVCQKKWFKPNQPSQIVCSIRCRNKRREQRRDERAGKTKPATPVVFDPILYSFIS